MRNSTGCACLDRLMDELQDLEVQRLRLKQTEIGAKAEYDTAAIEHKIAALGGELTEITAADVVYGTTYTAWATAKDAIAQHDVLIRDKQAEVDQFMTTHSMPSMVVIGLDLVGSGLGSKHIGSTFGHIGDPEGMIAEAFANRGRYPVGMMGSFGFPGDGHIRNRQTAARVDEMVTTGPAA